MSPVRTLDRVRLWEQVSFEGEARYAPADPNQMDPSKTYFQGNMGELKDKGHSIYLETKYEHFFQALKSSKPSVSPDDLHKYIDFTKTFGMDG